MVKVLLALEEVSPHKPDIGGGMPRSYAAGSGRVGAVKHDPAL